MNKLIEQIISGKAADAASLVEKVLDKKLATALIGQRAVVASEVYGGPDVTEDWDSAKAGIDADSLTKTHNNRNAHLKANAATNWGAKGPIKSTFAKLQKKRAGVPKGVA